MSARRTRSGVGTVETESAPSAGGNEGRRAAAPRPVHLGAQRAHQPALVDPVHPVALPPAAGDLHRRHLAGGVALRDRSTSSACSRSPAATTATSRTAATGSAAFPQFVLAFGGTTAAQKGPLWWAAHHRDHHQYSDTERDIHSPDPRLLVEPRRLDPLRQVQQDRQRRDQGLRQVPRARVARQARLGRAVERSASPATSSRAGAACSSGSSRRRSCSGTRRSPSTRSRTCSAGASTTRPTRAATRCSSR